MTCKELVELVTSYLDGDLDAPTERAFTDHLAMCDGCERYLDQFRVTIRLAGEVSDDDLSPPARDALLDAFRSWPADDPRRSDGQSVTPPVDAPAPEPTD